MLRQAGRQIKEAIAAGAEMLELRVDYLEKLNAELVKKLILTAKGRIPLDSDMPGQKTGRGN